MSDETAADTPTPDAGAAVPVPDNWDEMTDEQKTEQTAEILKRVADESGVDRGSEAEPDDSESRARPPRTFQVPEDE